MSDRHDDELDPRLRRELARSHGSDTPDPALEERVLEALRAEGLVAPAPGRTRGWRVAAAVAATLTAFALGVWAGGALGPDGTGDAAPVAATEAEGSLYLLLLLGEIDEEEEVLVREYSAWAREQAERGRLVRGEKLGDAVRRVGVAGAEVARDRPRAVTGFFLVRAADLEAAAELAESCPHARRGGGIEVRPVEPT